MIVTIYLDHKYFFPRSDSWSIYERLHNDLYNSDSAHVHWLRVREGTNPGGWNFRQTSTPSILYSKTTTPQILTLEGTGIYLLCFMRKTDQNL